MAPRTPTRHQPPSGDVYWSAQVRDGGREGSAVTGTGEEPEADARAGVTDSGHWTPGRFMWDVLKDRGLSCPGPSELGPGKSRAVTALWGPRGRDTAVALPGAVRSSGQAQACLSHHLLWWPCGQALHPDPPVGSEEERAGPAGPRLPT